MRKIKALAIFNGIAFLVHVSLAYLTQVKQFSQEDVGQVSARYETLFTPAGMTFAIWGIIYTLLAIFCLYHIVIAYKQDLDHPANKTVQKMGGLFILVNLASAAWLIVWTNQQIEASVILILVQLIGLLSIHHRLHIYDPLKIAAIKIANQFPLAVYSGWISIATIANISAWLGNSGWDGWGLTAIQWTIIMIIIAVVLAAFMMLVRRDIYFGLVIAWGLYGILLKRQATNADAYAQIIISAWIGIGIIGLLFILQLIRNISYKRPKPIFPSPSMPVK